MTRDYSKMSVEELEKELEEIFSILPKEQHNDLFRAVVYMGQMDIAKFIYHDKKNNPYTRYVNSRGKSAEISTFGQALIQLLLLMKARGLELAPVFKHAIEHMKDKDWMARKPENDHEVKGLPISGGRVAGKAYVVDEGNPLERAPEGSVIVLQHAEPEVAELLGTARAVVTDQGGRLSHIATVARERGLPAVLGTGNATTLIKTGDLILVDADQGRVTVSEE